jgi:hypothetical protein
VSVDRKNTCTPKPMASSTPSLSSKALAVSLEAIFMKDLEAADYKLWNNGNLFALPELKMLGTKLVALKDLAIGLDGASIGNQFQLLPLSENFGGKLKPASKREAIVHRSVIAHVVWAMILFAHLDVWDDKDAKLQSEKVLRGIRWLLFMILDALREGPAARLEEQKIRLEYGDAVANKVAQEARREADPLLSSKWSALLSKTLIKQHELALCKKAPLKTKEEGVKE